MNTSTAPKRAIIWKAVSSRVQAAEDKISLSEQERLSREICTRNGWAIVDVLTVPGHSRHYIDIHECAADMRAVGIDAFDRLLAHWKARDFDVLVTYDADRFARTQTLHAHVTETTVRGGAIIYSVTDGEINASNYRMWISMSGYRAAAYIDRLTSGRRASIPSRLKRGFSATGRYPFTHKVLRDERGKAVKVVLNAEALPLVHAAVELLLQGMAYEKIGLALRERGFDGVNIGKQYLQFTMRWHGLFFSPPFWGHLSHSNAKIKTGAWAFDADAPLPEGVYIERNVISPVLSGELAERVKSELRRRTDARKSPHSRERAHMFSGILICTCGHRMRYDIHHNKGVYRCHRRNPDTGGFTCKSTTTREAKIKEWIDTKLIKRLIRIYQKTGQLAQLGDSASQHSIAVMLEGVEKNIQEIDMRLRRLIGLQSSTDDSTLQSMYAEDIHNLTTQRKAQSEQLKSLQTRARHRPQETRQGLERIIEAGERFWELPESEINSMLYQLLGGMVINLDNREIIGLTEPKVNTPPR